VSGGQDTSALVWDATRPRTRDSSVRHESTASDLTARFRDLAGENAERAHAAVWALVNSPKAASFLGEQRSLFVSIDVDVIERWIRDLDSNKFTLRERASQELGLILDEAESHLKKARQARTSAEAQQRIDQLLHTRSLGSCGRELQRLRVIEVLEHIASPDAVAIMQKLAAGPAEARPTREAKASLERLALRTDQKR
jgi:hypothetical protein